MINYNMLSLARQLRGYTQKEVSEGTGVSQAELSKVERGLRVPSTELIKTLSSYYDIPQSFFKLKSNQPEGSTHFYRRKATQSKKELDKFEAVVSIYQNIIDTLLEGIELPGTPLTRYVPNDYLTPSEIASNIRYELRIPRGPVPNLSTLLENHQIIIIQMDFGNSNIDGLNAQTKNGYTLMFINDSMPADRIRFSMAHELGHIIMHQEHIPKDISLAEEQANEFASEFLMPIKDIKSQLRGINLSTASQLKRLWKVSMRALIRRARDLSQITERQYSNLQVQISRAGYSTKEPITIPRENPETLKYIIENIYKGELFYSDDDLMNLFCINSTDYEVFFPFIIPKPNYLDVKFPYISD